MNPYEETTILIVDDSPTNSIFLLTLLKQSGFNAVVANSGESALKKSREDFTLLQDIYRTVQQF